jgi:hypothetical protein
MHDVEVAVLAVLSRKLRFGDYLAEVLLDLLWSFDLGADGLLHHRQTSFNLSRTQATVLDLHYMIAAFIEVLFLVKDINVIIWGRNDGSTEKFGMAGVRPAELANPMIRSEQGLKNIDRTTIILLSVPDNRAFRWKALELLI